MSLPRYPKYKASGVEWLGDVPITWRVQRLKHVSVVMPSNVDKKSYDDELLIRLCNYTDVYYNEKITASIDFMRATASEEQVQRFQLQADDIIITKDSEEADDIAVSAYVPETLPGVVCGYHLALIRPREDCDGRYIKRLFDSPYLKSCVAVSANGLTRVGLSQYALDNLEIPFPSLAEQTAIAAFLDRETAKIDALVAEQERLIALLKEKRQAVISHAVTKGLNPDAPMKPSGVEWLGDVPRHWEVRALRTLSAVVRGASPRPAGDPTLFNGDFVPWVTVAEITKDSAVELQETADFLTEKGADASRLFKAGCVIYSNSGATLGVPKILRIDACANDGVVGFESLDRSLLPIYLYHYLFSLTPIIRDMVKQGSGQPNLNTDIVKAIPIARPPPEEQHAIAAFLEAEGKIFNALTEEVERAMHLLKERRGTLISAAVTGQIDTRHAA